MSRYRILFVGRPGPLTQQMMAFGHVVHHSDYNRRLWVGLPSGTWDACILAAEQLRGEESSLIRHARESQPSLAILIAGGDPRELKTLGLITGADDVISAEQARQAARRVAHAVTFRRARARARGGVTQPQVLVLDWDQVEAPAVRNALAKDGFAVTPAGDAWSVLEQLRAIDFEVLLAPPVTLAQGCGVVEAALRYDPRLRIVVTSDTPSLADAAAAMGQGAFDYLLRPVGPEQAVGAVRNALSAYGNTGPGGAPRARQLHVLLIDNHSGEPRVVEQMLAQDGNHIVCVCVREVKQALRRFTDRPFDAVVCNIESNRASAIQMVHELMLLENQPAVLMIAADPDAALYEQAIRLGVQDVISYRALGREALASRVRSAVQRNQYRLQHDRFVRDLQTRDASQQEVVRRSGDAILIVDARGVVVFSNPAAERMFAKPSGLLLGAPFEFDLSGQDRREIEIRQGTSVCVADMTVGEIDWNGSRARLVSLRDVTERQQARLLRDRLAHTERLAAIGQLAAGVTHEINNPAAYVVANLSTMQELTNDLAARCTGHPELLERIKDISEMIRENLDGMSRICSITKDLRTFARIDSNEISPVDLNDCAHVACKIAFNEIRQRAHLIQELERLPTISGARGKLAQVITNLLVNAAQAIPEGDAANNRVTVRTGLRGEHVWLQVEDTGRGLSEDVQRRMFDPFFTTKTLGQGTGLGLSLCADIVRQHCGTIEARNAPGGGALFEIRLPLENDFQSARLSSHPASETRLRPTLPRKLRVLLIDDEPLVLRSLRRMLSAHAIDTATGGAEALAKLARDDRYDLIFCDMMMPEMDGTSVYAALEERFPSLLERLVFCSGGAFTPRTKAFIEEKQVLLVEKPLTLEAFVQAAERVCSERPLARAMGSS